MLIDSTSTTTGDGTKSGAAKAKLDEDLNRFLNLLVTQLKNQDPLDPMDANEFTSQLVQFASVEQQIYQNSNLEKLLAVQQTSQVASMVDFIGNTIEASGNVVPLENANAEIAYQIPANAQDVTITFQDTSGKTVFTIAGDPDIGRHEFVWDGMDGNAIAQADGAYIVTVTALDRAGDLLEVPQTVFGRVTGAGAVDGKVSLYMGDAITGLDKVLSVRETKPAI
ncbi:MAG: flagellar hook assembly protein FlgD [Rhodospirillaceae bacterium]|nr:flagellar hook assembly protein FlgD [Rhodospirillaceae bacterium]